MSKQEHNFTATTTVKFKMYKAKKQWIMAALAFMTGAAIMVDHATVSADTTDAQAVTQVTDNTQQSDISDTNTNSAASHVNVLTNESTNAADTSVSTNVQTDSDNSLVDNSQNKTTQEQSTNTVSNQDNSSTVSTSTTSEPTKVDSLDDNNLKSQYSDDMKASNIDYVNDVVSSETTVNDLSEVPDGNQSTTRVYYTETKKLNPPKGYISGTLPGSAGSMKAQVNVWSNVDNITISALTDNGYLNIEASDGEWVHLEPATFQVQVPTGTLHVNAQSMTADDIQKLITELANNTKINYQGTMYDAEVNINSNGHRFMLFKDSNNNILKISALTGTNVPSEKDEITIAVDIADSLQVGKQLNMDTMFTLGTNLYGNQVSYTTSYTYKTVTSEQMVSGNIVPKDEQGNPVGPETPYGPVAPGTTIETPYGPVEVPTNGGDITVTVATETPGIAVYEKTAVDEPEYVVAGNIVPKDEQGNPVGPETPYGPVTPGTTIDTPYGPVEVPTNGGDITVTVATETPGIAVYEKTAVDEPEYVVAGNIVPKDEQGNPVGPETPYGPVKPGTTIDTPYGPVVVPETGGDVVVTIKTAVDVPEHLELPAEDEPGIAVYEKVAVDVPEYVVAGNIVPEDENGNSVGPKIPYGPLEPNSGIVTPHGIETPGIIINTPYGPVEVPANGGDIVVTVASEVPGIAVYEKTAVDVPEYVVSGNIVPEDENGNPVGPEIPYGPVAPGTTIDTPYGPVIVPDAGGDVVIVVKVETNKKSPISDIKDNPTTTQEVVLPVASPNNDGQPVNMDHSENTDKQLPKTSASQNHDHVVISGLVLTSLLGLLALLKRKNNN
ncbi:KxYKxGKxW signal peptide domain-containing protein [Leuconostoc falkenbergense]|uniref:KxYKxGKxW signal peptide domain-containing protein n=1 Tax=Leuconostoc falkenbergense TaxID=2766470 RepID=UPI00196762D0|nr:KxYKxGKxW signal peptide domain-containing protein [Leuconostoc falkenbergense]QSB51627.1 KxYKxGKxW signal peptide domain-containing protein [Leuconostoc falkenbergense]